jgi:hypothetical protein
MSTLKRPGGSPDHRTRSGIIPVGLKRRERAHAVRGERVKRKVQPVSISQALSRFLPTNPLTRNLSSPPPTICPPQSESMLVYYEDKALLPSSHGPRITCVTDNTKCKKNQSLVNFSSVLFEQARSMRASREITQSTQGPSIRTKIANDYGGFEKSPTVEARSATSAPRRSSVGFYSLDLSAALNIERRPGRRSDS